MNEKIRELYTSNSQAFSILDCLRDPYDAVRNGDSYSSIEVDLQRFAELIVRECVHVCLNVDSEYFCEYINGKLCAEEIKQHFEVAL